MTQHPQYTISRSSKFSIHMPMWLDVRKHCTHKKNVSRRPMLEPALLCTCTTASIAYHFLLFFTSETTLLVKDAALFRARPRQAVGLLAVSWSQWGC